MSENVADSGLYVPFRRAKEELSSSLCIVGSVSHFTVALTGKLAMQGSRRRDDLHVSLGQRRRDDAAVYRGEWAKYGSSAHLPNLGFIVRAEGETERETQSEQ